MVHTSTSGRFAARIKKHPVGAFLFAGYVQLPNGFHGFFLDPVDARIEAFVAQFLVNCHRLHFDKKDTFLCLCSLSIQCIIHTSIHQPEQTT